MNYLIYVVALLANLHLILGEPEWKVIPQDQCKQVGDAVSLICTVANIDVNDMEWTAIFPTRRPVSVGQFINPAECPSACTISGDENIGEYILTIDPLESKDFGIWQCSAPTADPQAYTMYLSAPDTCNNVTISVNDYNLTESNIYTVHSGSNLTFICDPHGCQYPCVTTKWFNGTEEIQTSTENNELSLTVSEYDDGISIKCSANVATDPPVEDIRVLDVLHKPIVFEILILVGSQPFTKGNKVELECSSNGNPDPNYEWKVGDEVLQNTDRIINIEFINEVTVVCTATNEYGTDSSRIILKENEDTTAIVAGSVVGGIACICVVTVLCIWCLPCCIGLRTKLVTFCLCCTCCQRNCRVKDNLEPVTAEQSTGNSNEMKENSSTLKDTKDKPSKNV